jgi:putative membrane protein
MKEIISSEEQQRIMTAIKQAEKKTSAELFAVLARRSDDYRFIAYSMIAMWILVCSCILAIWLDYRQVAIDPLTLVIAQLLAMVSAIAVFRLVPSIVCHIAPKRITDERAHANAVKQFMAHGIHKTSFRTGVLIFVSMDERYGEIIVDSAVEEKLGRKLVTDCVAMLIDECANERIAEGYLLAISRMGEELARVLPKIKNNPNELEDKLIIL